MATAFKFKVSRHPPVTVDYDRPLDVLIVTLGHRVPMEGEGRPRGLELDYALSTGEPCAAKVIGFRRYGWSSNVEMLADLIASHLSIPSTDLVHQIREKARLGR